MFNSADPVLYRLHRALETGASREEVAEALAAAESARPDSSSDPDDVLSPLLLFRAQEYIQAERMLERRRLLFAVTCVVFLFAAVVAGFGLTTLDRMRSLVDHETEFNALVDREQWDQASVYLDALNEETRQEPVFVRGREMVDQAIAREQERKAEFKRLADNLRAPGESEFDREQVDRLNELARSAEELEIAAEVNARAEEQRLREQAARANDQTHQFEALQQKLDQFLKVESASLSEDARTAKRFELQQELARFVTDHQFSNPDLAEAAKQAAKSLVTSATLDKQRSSRDEFVAAITASIGDVDAYVAAIDQFTTQWPNDSLAGRLAARMPVRPEIEASLAWIKVLDHTGYRNPRTADSEVARSWLQLYSDAMSMDDRHPLASAPTNWKQRYQTLAQCDAVIDELQQVFQSPLLNSIYVYPDSDGQVWYSEQPPSGDSDRAHLISVLVDTSIKRQTKNFGLRFRESVLPKVKLSGHSQFASKVAPLVADVTSADFTPVAYRLINELRTFQSDPEFDPIYRLILMRQLLQLAVRGSTPIATALGDWAESLEASDFPWTINWLVSASDDAERPQKLMQAKRLLESVDNWDQRVETMLDSFKSFRSTRPAAPRWIGWVSQNKSQYEAVLSESTEAGTLVVFTKDPQTGQSGMVEIGPAAESGPTAITIPTAQQCGAIVCILPAGPEPNQATD